MFGKLRPCLHGLQCESWVPWRLQPSLGLLQTLLLLTVEHISLAPGRAREELRDEWETSPVLCTWASEELSQVEMRQP